MPQKISFLEHEKYSENPYTQDKFLAQVKQNFASKNIRVSDKANLINEDTGEKDNFLAIYRRHKYDKEQFVKFYLQRNYLELIFKMSAKARGVLIHVIRRMEPNSDVVRLDLDGQQIRQDSGYTSKATLYRGLEELIRNEVIAKSVYGGTFFINPNILFNGDRVIFIDSVEKKKGVKRINGSQPKFVIAEAGEKFKDALSDFQDIFDNAPK